MDIFEELESFRRVYDYCEDSWYSCPKSEDGCADERQGTECNCGADKSNKRLDRLIIYLHEKLDK